MNEEERYGGPFDYGPSCPKHGTTKCPTCGKDPEVNVEERRQLLKTGNGIGREEVKRAVVRWLEAQDDYAPAHVLAEELAGTPSDELASD